MVGETASTLRFDSVQASDFAIYRVVVKWTNGLLELPEFVLSEGDAAALSDPATVVRFERIGSFPKISWESDNRFRLMLSQDLLAWVPSPYSASEYDNLSTVAVPIAPDNPYRFFRLEPSP